MSTAQAPFSISDLARRLQDGARQLEAQFLGKEEIIRLLFISALAGEHMVMVGPPGTAKSAIVRAFAQVIDARFFDYLLTRFTEPNEIFGPVDIQAFRQGTYRRRIDKMLPEAEVVFLDEIFKANSAILNSLLTLVNARRFMHGTNIVRVPLISLFAASNEVPTDEALSAIFDRFLLRVRCDYLDSYHFRGLLQKGIQLEVQQMGEQQVGRKVATAAELLHVQRTFGQHIRMSEEFLTTFKGLVFQIRSEGIGRSDRRVVKLLKLFAGSAFLDGRSQPDASDFFVLKHIWNNEDQAAILESIVTPVLEAHYRDHPNARRVGAAGIGIEALAGEIDRVRQVLTGGGGLSDVQLFSQLKALNEIKAALGASPDPRAPELVQRVDQLLEAAFRSGRFAQL